MTTDTLVKRNHPAFRDTPVESAQQPQRGDIWFVDARSAAPGLGSHRSVGCEIWSNKCAVVVSNDRMNSRSGFVQVVYLSASLTRNPSSIHPAVEMPATPSGENGGSAIAYCEQVTTVDLSRLRERRGQVSAAELAAIETTVRWSLGLGRAPRAAN